MRNLLFILLAGFTLWATGCDSTGGKDGTQTTEAGSRYTYLSTNDDGQLAEAGEFIYFNAILKTEGDSVLINTKEGGGPPPVIQALSDSIVTSETGPVEDVLRNIRVGERVLIRANLDQFPRKPPGMENDSVLLYDLEVTEIIDQDEFTARQEAVAEEARVKAEEVRGRMDERLTFSEQVYNDYKAGKLDGELQTTPSGLRYILHEEGSGAEAAPGKTVSVQYIGRLSSDGEIFDQSFERGSAIQFPLGQGRVIPGWDEGIDLLQVGDRATFIIPSELAYGPGGTPDGSIAPDSELLFYVELEEVL
ncbi:hypothetical protein LEM8419_01681 [Neolewinella maritima]|uniref:Peptidyl-prolyl cis-trans isomerase n=1 Tax=Neolewinella maritima TaxID=1383882 RepID=A0ABN8F1D4_9BACT|nr:FKBP-type peptidyl-prolyl cis-trans isomerase [Neolewinella maritima]CAH1000528.1 hypothetical protein LEM8419_01681 [Neolewinella maritima]